VLLFLVGDETKDQLRSTESIEPIIILCVKIVIKITMSYFGAKQLAFNNNNSFYSNKAALEKVAICGDEATRNVVSEYLHKAEDNTNTNSCSDC